MRRMSDSRRSSVQEPVLGFSTSSELSNKLKKGINSHSYRLFTVQAFIPLISVHLFELTAVGRLSENMHIIANEPSLALFCLQASPIQVLSINYRIITQLSPFSLQ